MERASEIVDFLLETGAQKGAAGVYVFGPAYPNGAPFRDLAQAVSQLRYLKAIPRNSSATAAPRGAQVSPIDSAIEQGYLILNKKTPADVVVYAEGLPYHVPKDAADKALMWLGVDDNSKVVHRTSESDGRGNTVYVKNVFYGDKQQGHAQSPAQQAQAPASPATTAPPNTPAAPRRYSPQSFLRRRGIAPNVAAPKPALSLEFQAANTSIPGCYVYAAHDGGPMALAGIQGGDVIDQATYSKGTATKSVVIRDRTDMENMLKDADEKRILLRVRRGGLHLTFPVTPVRANED